MIPSDESGAMKFSFAGRLFNFIADAASFVPLLKAFFTIEIYSNSLPLSNADYLELNPEQSELQASVTAFAQQFHMIKFSIQSGLA